MSLIDRTGMPVNVGDLFTYGSPFNRGDRHGTVTALSRYRRHTWALEVTWADTGLRHYDMIEGDNWMERHATVQERERT